MDCVSVKTVASLYMNPFAGDYLFIRLDWIPLVSVSKTNIF